MKQQPGVMLYFEVRPCLERLSLEDQGQLFRAILDYGEYGIEPDFQYMLGIAWDFIRPRLDRDRDRYADKLLKSRYAVYVREVRRSSENPLPYSQWLDAGQPVPPDDNGCDPTTTAAPTVTQIQTQTQPQTQ